MKESILEINKKNLIENFNWYKSQSLNQFICPMVKANSYGAGEEQVFKILNKLNVSAFGVVRLSEGLSLRKKDPNVKILMFNPCDVSDYEHVIDHKITPVISSISAMKDLEIVLKAKSIKDYNVHVEVDTGMNRLGFQLSKMSEFFKELINCKSILVEGVFSHFMSAEDWPDKLGKSYEQLIKFEDVVRQFKEFKNKNINHFTSDELIFHLSSSKALNDDGLAKDYNNKLMSYGLRPGLGLYGISQKNKNLKPVLSLKSPVIELKWIQKGESVSYDGIWVASQKTLVGTLPLGYGDGYPRSLAENTYVLINGQKVPVIGKICMDFMMIDCTPVQESVKLSDLALVFGYESDTSGISIEDLSERAGIITYELIVGLSSRLKRRVTEI